MILSFYSMGSLAFYKFYSQLNLIHNLKKSLDTNFIGYLEYFSRIRIRTNKHEQNRPANVPRKFTLKFQRETSNRMYFFGSEQPSPREALALFFLRREKPVEFGVSEIYRVTCVFSFNPLHFFCLPFFFHFFFSSNRLFYSSVGFLMA